MLTIFTRHRHALALTAAAASWGFATAITKHAVNEISPTTLLPLQLASSLLVLGPLVLFRGQPMPWSPKLRRLGYLGVLNPGISYALSLLGLVYITASMSVLLWATEPILIVGLSWWLVGDRIDRRLAIAAAVALSVVILVVLREEGGGAPIGVILTLAGVAACAFYTVISCKWITTEGTIEVVTVQQAAALVFALVLALVVAAVTGTRLPDASATAWASAVTSGILYYGLGFWLYLTGLRHVPAVWAGLFLTLIPLFGILAGRLLLDEELSPRQWFGGLLIVVAVVAIAGRLARSSEGQRTADQPKIGSNHAVTESRDVGPSGL